MKIQMNWNHKILVLGVISCICFAWIGCSQKVTGNASAPATAPVPKHEHKPPHHGTLVVLGKEFSHVEMVLDPESGKLSAYALDGEAENPVKLAQKEMVLQITMTNSDGGGKKHFTMKLVAVPNTLTGETVGDTSEFDGQSDSLKGVKDFDAVLTDITIRGSEFKDTVFNFPKGNDTD